MVVEVVLVVDGLVGAGTGWVVLVVCPGPVEQAEAKTAMARARVHRRRMEKR
jgi:hypothetical protein